MKKIIVIGSSGSGKSTLSKKLSQQLGIEVYHLDRLFWQPNWQLCSLKEQQEIQEKLVKKSNWIIDGNYGKTLSIRVQACDTLIFLDRPRLICLYQVLKRVNHYKNKTRPDMGDDCPEKFDWLFLKWVWNFPKDQRPQIIATLKDFPKNKTVIWLKNQRQINHFLATIQEEHKKR